jgi:hypothetical protein
MSAPEYLHLGRVKSSTATDQRARLTGRPSVYPPRAPAPAARCRGPWSEPQERCGLTRRRVRAAASKGPAGVPRSASNGGKVSDIPRPFAPCVGQLDEACSASSAALWRGLGRTAPPFDVTAGDTTPHSLGHLLLVWAMGGDEAAASRTCRHHRRPPGVHGLHEARSMPRGSLLPPLDGRRSGACGMLTRMDDLVIENYGE